MTKLDKGISPDVCARGVSVLKPGLTSQRLHDLIKPHIPQLGTQLTRPCRSQPHKSCKRNDTKPDFDTAIDQHLLENERCGLNYDKIGFQFSSQHATLST